jgi:putative transposase
MPRTARIAPGGIVFHVLNRGNGGMKLFRNAADYAAFVNVLADVQREVPTRLLAYCLMPNHWHLVLWPTEDGQLGRFMQRLTVTHVRRWHAMRTNSEGGHVYQGIYKSFPVEAVEHLPALCRFVESNPRRGGLVRRAEDWQWSSLWQRVHGEDAGDAAPKVELARWPVPVPSNWVGLVNAALSGAEEQAIRDSITRGRPLGDESWQRRTAAKLNLAHTFRGRGRPKKVRPKMTKVK